MTSELSPTLETAIREGFERRDRENMAPTIEYFQSLLAEHPDNPFVLYEVGGSYDTDGQEERAIGYYEQALVGGLLGDTRRRCLLQYGSTLRNLERFAESLEIFEQARAEFPESDSLRVFQALSLHAAAKSDQALAELLLLVADRIDSTEIERYEAAIRGNAEYLRDRTN